MCCVFVCLSFCVFVFVCVCVCVCVFVCVCVCADGHPVPLPHFWQDFATFMLVRGPYAWLGYSWVGCNVEYEYPDALLSKYGAPLGVCAETSHGSGVFVREFANAKASMDCNSWTGNVTLTA